MKSKYPSTNGSTAANHMQELSFNQIVANQIVYEPLLKISAKQTLRQSSPYKNIFVYLENAFDKPLKAIKAYLSHRLKQRFSAF